MIMIALVDLRHFRYNTQNVCTFDTRNQSEYKAIVSSYLQCTRYSSRSLRVYISSVALYVDFRRETENLGHLWSKRYQTGAEDI